MTKKLSIFNAYIDFSILKVSNSRTEIKDNAFIGCNSTLIAPITVGKDAVVGAGSVVTTDVPDKALAIERASQVIKENYRD